MNWLTTFVLERLIKGIVIKRVILGLESFLAKVPGNDRKMVTGIVVAMLGAIIEELPETGLYVQPILDALHSLPAEQVVGGGLAWAGLGLFHKALKWVKKFTTPAPAAPTLVVVQRTPSE